ncbi:hypothetical protein OFR22_04685 [Brachyspira hyodysenteriae]|uniref:Uncharacterized protein n=1 Tax=Brachyspira hyodysenteriae ATCC 27164 TaxID=1266923 RepID=A0A3B6VR34_BRAHO|nr:hypothetical protein [Brachyspira hyodysenteriae]ANN63310.1 hypothetical protein BHYOB78_05370 [Brachyspira hyodysenteriae ATCC 27164]AUJ50348.1 hypothetical protein BH718_01915 [Brachyspira hyodysenteriae]KLI13874.1 hypothetical protein SU45_11800 [Brachyspira hyodysenteriae]KLI14556.1 hypothetical protein SU44_10680 [Brachyspira hyodysenteriae]KLI19877.1 hypothetical protein SU46_05630 [Brachyspira hyodysenteriae]
MPINFFSNKSNLNTVHYIVSNLLTYDDSISHIIRVNKNIKKYHFKKSKKKINYRSEKFGNHIKLIS